MLDIQKVKEILKDDTLSDDEARDIRDTFQVLADIILDQWLEDLGKGASKCSAQESNGH